MNSSNQFIPTINVLADDLSADSSSRHNTLKDMLKRAMDTKPSPQRRRASLLDAASALASLGGGSPRPSYDEERIQDGHGGRAVEPMSATGQTIPMTFPEKLMEVLSNDQISDIIAWLPHGKGFVILQKRKFASEVMPVYFKQSKFTSFTRKLNRWGFTRAAHGPEVGAYYHQYFQRGNHLLCMQMHCQISTTSSKVSSCKASDKSSTRSSESANLLVDLTSPRSLPLPTRSSERLNADLFVDLTSSPLPSAQENNTKIDDMLYTGNSQGPDNMAAFDVVLQRQKQLLRESQAVSHSESSSVIGQTPGFDRVFDFYNASARQLCQPQYLMQRQPRFNEVDRVVEPQRLPSSRRHHQFIIESALSALESRNSRANYSPTLTKDYDTAAQGSATSSPRLQAQLHSAMQARLRQLKEYNTSVDDALKNDPKRSTVSQLEVSQLRNEIGQRRPFLTGAFSSHSSSYDDKRSSPTPRGGRASAA